MADYHKMPSGAFPVNLAGNPVLITRAEYEACCCNTYCRVELVYECLRLQGGTAVTPNSHTTGPLTGPGSSGKPSFSPAAAVDGAGRVYAVRTNGVWNTDPDDPLENCWKSSVNAYYNGGSSKDLFSFDYPEVNCLGNKFTANSGVGRDRGQITNSNSFDVNGSQGVVFNVSSNTPSNNICFPGATITITLYRVVATHTWVAYFPKTAQSCVDAHSGTLPGALPACSGSEFIRRFTPVGEGITEVAAIGGDAGWS